MFSAPILIQNRELKKITVNLNFYFREGQKSSVLILQSLPHERIASTEIASYNEACLRESGRKPLGYSKANPLMFIPAFYSIKVSLKHFL